MNINTLDLNLLLVLDALQRTHSVTLAGEQLCISQSGVSNALRRLRDAFGDELFVRTDSGMMPTPLAESMAEPIQAALQQIRQTIENRGCFDAQPLKLLLPSPFCQSWRHRTEQNFRPRLISLARHSNGSSQ